VDDFAALGQTLLGEAPGEPALSLDEEFFLDESLGLSAEPEAEERSDFGLPLPEEVIPAVSEIASLDELTFEENEMGGELGSLEAIAAQPDLSGMELERPLEEPIMAMDTEDFSLAEIPVDQGAVLMEDWQSPPELDTFSMFAPEEAELSPMEAENLISQELLQVSAEPEMAVPEESFDFAIAPEGSLPELDLSGLELEMPGEPAPVSESGALPIAGLMGLVAAPTDLTAMEVPESASLAISEVDLPLPPLPEPEDLAVYSNLYAGLEVPSEEAGAVAPPTIPPAEGLLEESGTIISLMEEQVVVDYVRRKVGEVIIRKQVETRMVQVPVRYEKLVIEQVSPDRRQLAEVDLSEMEETEPADLSLRHPNGSRQVVSGEFTTPRAASHLLDAIAKTLHHRCHKIRVEIELEDPTLQAVYQQWMNQYQQQ